MAVTARPAAELRRLLGDDPPSFAALVPEAAAVLGPMPAERVPVDMQTERSLFLQPVAEALLPAPRPAPC